MPDRMTEKVREKEIFCREDTPTEPRVLGAVLYHARLSYRRIESFVERSHETVGQWF